MKVVDSIKKKARDVVRRRHCLSAPRNPVYVFHHIPKCGGTSLNRVLDKSFITIKDYRSGWTMNYPDKVDICRLRSCHCLCGHFELNGYYLHERYPEVFMSNRYRVFTFVRDPLRLQLSLFRHEKRNNQSRVNSIEEHLSLRPNYLANRFPATIDNYKDVINRYFFVGILEKSETSHALLSSMMGRRLAPLPWLNKTRSDTRKDTEYEMMSEELITQFRKANALDYLIYDYCVAEFGRISAEQGAPLDVDSAALHPRH
jgi:hypothetical protein